MKQKKKITEDFFNLVITSWLGGDKPLSHPMPVNLIKHYACKHMPCDQNSFHRMLKKLAKKEHVKLAGTRITERKPGKVFIRPNTTVMLTETGAQAYVQTFQKLTAPGP